MTKIWNAIKGPATTFIVVLAALAFHQKVVAPRLAPKAPKPVTPKQ